MLGGARRPRPTDWLGLVCRAMEEVLRIDQRLVPFLAEQERQQQERKRMQEVESALTKVYGPPDPNAPSHEPVPSTPVDLVRFYKDLEALEKTRALTALLKAKLARKR
jgi:hypothetical protein